MKQYLKRTPIICIALVLCQCACTSNWPDARVSVKLTNESGASLPAEPISVSYALPEGSKQSYKYQTVNGLTDAKGVFTATHTTIGNVGCIIKKDGYYESYGEYRFHTQQGGRWLPWNPEINLILRKKEDRVPMYARDTHMSGLVIPVVGKEVGFDLMEYEWMPPYGKGKHPDFVFKLGKNFINENDYQGTLTISFSNKQDGIQLHKENRKFGSAFKLPRFAPEVGYKPKLQKVIKREPNKATENDFEDDNNYFFRVRSEVRNGTLATAMYGKIQGDIKFYPVGAKTAAIVFTYYLNPDRTRNMEYGTNLFKNLRETEHVGLDQ